MELHDAFDAPVPAVVLAEGKFGTPEGKTANGVVMHSELFDAKAVVDSTRAGKTASEVLTRSDVPEIPVVESVDAALRESPDAEALVIGVAPAGGQLPEEWAEDIGTAMRNGCDVVSGLHTFLSEHARWRELADETGVRLFDVRKPPADDDLRVADGKVDDCRNGGQDDPRDGDQDDRWDGGQDDPRDGDNETTDADVVLTMGTDCAVGKRTTTFELYRAAESAGLDAGWVATGQTGILVGADRGVVIDRVPADFTAGVVEDMICAVADEHDLVFVEGQAALTHRAYSGVTLSLLHGANPDAVVLVDDPDRAKRADFDRFAVAGIEREMAVIDALAERETTIAALSTWGDADEQAATWGLPAANVYDDGGPAALLDAVLDAL